MQRGASLLELLLVLALASALTAMAIPHGVGALDGVLARQAADRLALAHGRARQLALALQQVARLTITADSLTVSVGDTIRWSLPGPASGGVALAGGDAFTEYAPNGLAMGAANTGYSLSRGRARLSVMISRLGRVRIVRSGG